MSILKNAVDSIKIGMEDYELGKKKPERFLSSVRNLHAGILLFYKEKLRRLSPPNSNDIFIKSKNLPEKDKAGNIIFVGVEKKTVNVHQIQERFNALKICTDWKRFTAINTIRNDIEHYYISKEKNITEVISNTFILIRNFIRKELSLDPLKILGESTWNKMLEIEEVYEKEEKECYKKLKSIVWDIEEIRESLDEIHCLSCGSHLVAPVNTSERPNIKCRVCGKKSDFEDYAESVIEKYYCGDNYVSITDGGEPVNILCPNCFKETYIVEENECRLCGYEPGRICRICSISIPDNERGIDVEICSDCEYQHYKM